MALTDRHFLAEHFDILFAFFGFMVQKIWNFKVGIHFLPFVLNPEIGPNRYLLRAGLATETDRRGPNHAGKPRRPDGPPAGLNGRGRHDRRASAVTGGKPRTDPSVRADPDLTEATGVLYVWR